MDSGPGVPKSISAKRPIALSYIDSNARYAHEPELSIQPGASMFCPCFLLFVAARQAGFVGEATVARSIAVCPRCLLATGATVKV